MELNAESKRKNLESICFINSGNRSCYILYLTFEAWTKRLTAEFLLDHARLTQQCPSNPKTGNPLNLRTNYVCTNYASYLPTLLKARAQRFSLLHVFLHRCWMTELNSNSITLAWLKRWNTSLLTLSRPCSMICVTFSYDLRCSLSAPRRLDLTDSFLRWLALLWAARHQKAWPLNRRARFTPYRELLDKTSGHPILLRAFHSK